ncbi:hypothetical protein EDD17DRAFT_883945 [Pisolithus thermaeus]|nr:hypothetical protein EDD17DRAFT_883945 [Pisolithus thermaeus]
MTVSPMPFVTLYTHLWHLPTITHVGHALHHLLSLCFFYLFFVVFIVSVIYYFEFYIQLAASWSVFYFRWARFYRSSSPSPPPYSFQQLLVGGNDFSSPFCSGAFPSLLWFLKLESLAPQRQCIYCDLSRAGRSTDLKNHNRYLCPTTVRSCGVQVLPAKCVKSG